MFKLLDVPANLSDTLMERGNECDFLPSEEDSEDEES